MSLSYLLVLDGTVEHKTCGNGVSCCNVCDSYTSEDEKTNCLALLLDDDNTFEEATKLCKNIIKDDPNYCHNIPDGKRILYQI